MLTFLPLLSSVDDKDAVLNAGLTTEEAEAWCQVSKTAKLLLDLPDMHTMEKQEISSAIHLIQTKLLARPTYRKYLSFYEK